MRVLIDINHPAHVHLFRNAAAEWLNRGHEVLLTWTDKAVVRQLIEAYNLPNERAFVRADNASKIDLARELLQRTTKLLAISRRFKPDVLISTGSPTAAAAATTLRKPHFAFDDTEDSIGQAWLYRPFTKAICVPDCFMGSFGEKEVRYAGYHELAYLHPNRFTPNPIKIHPLLSNERYFVLRFISWEAAHDSGAWGFSEAGKRRLIDLLGRFGRVVLSEEKSPPRLLAKGDQPEVVLSADAMHDLLAYATLYVGEGVTAASEAAVLGTPSILVNSREMGYIKEQAERYGLGYRLTNEDEVLAKISRMLAQPDLKNVWYCRQQVMLRDKVDVTTWILDFIEGALEAG